MIILTEAEIKAYYEGKKEGIWLYARWKDGTQYVGHSSIQTLNAVLKELEEEKVKALKAFLAGEEVTLGDEL